jgi:hypothetical protein
MERAQAVALVSALLILGFVLNLVRRRRLREEYSWLWLLAAIFYLALGVFPNLVNMIADTFGITSPVTTLFFIGLFFTIIILIHYSVKLSRLATNMKDVAQQIAILEGEQTKLNQELDQIKVQMENILTPSVVEEKDDVFEPVEAKMGEAEELTKSIA